MKNEQDLSFIAEALPAFISDLRARWGQGEFPFFIVQLAADQPWQNNSLQGSAWAELREAQTLTMSKLPKTGQCVITDLGEANDIHPKNKRDVAERLARWALVNDYGQKLPYHSNGMRFSAFDADGKPAFNSEAGVRALDWFVNLYKAKAVPAGTTNYLWDDSARASPPAPSRSTSTGLAGQPSSTTRSRPRSPAMSA